MKKVLFFISVLGLAGCSGKTVKNNRDSDIKVGETVVAAGACADEWTEGVFGLFGDYPVAITDTEGKKLHESNEEKYEAAHYVVAADGKITKAEEACEQPKEEPKEDEKEDEKEGEEEEGEEEKEGESTNVPADVPASTTSE